MRFHARPYSTNSSGIGSAAGDGSWIQTRWMIFGIRMGADRSRARRACLVGGGGPAYLRARMSRPPKVARLLKKLVGAQVKPRAFAGSAAYWEERYRKGGNSGAGSYAHFAEFKAEVLNAFVAEKSVASVIEFGCGDGNQLSLAKYPRYLGVDVSAAAVAKCRAMFTGDKTKTFATTADYAGQT